MGSISENTLFTPIKVGNTALQHRIAMAPLTRLRADDTHTHHDMAVKYYGQRASTPGTLLITEATFIAGQAGGIPNVPGIWSDVQIAAWKKVTDEVHAHGSFIFLQLWALGRAASHEQLLSEDSSYPYVSASDVPLTGKKGAPRPLTIPEIKDYVRLYAAAASNAVHKAGFDGVEIHSANGYLPDQFLQDVSNKRTDDYGGSIENRTRFTSEIVDAVAAAVGPEQTGIRISPWSPFQDMGMKDPIPTFTHLVNSLRTKQPNLAYLHLVEPRVAGGLDVTDTPHHEATASNDFARAAWHADGVKRPFLIAGQFTPDSALEKSKKTGDIIVFGRHFIANPDLPVRIREGIPLTKYNRSTLYVHTEEGYTDYEFAKL